MTVVVAGLQLAFPRNEPRAARIDRVVALVEEAPEADLLVLPELWDVGYFAFDDYMGAAEPLGEGPVAAVASVAARRRCTIVTGSVLERDDDRLYNTTAVVGSDGRLLGSYRKSHLFGHRSREAELLSPGTGPAVVASPLGNLGLATCFDLRFPEHFAELRSRQADLFVVVAAWPAARADHWRVLVQARAIECQTPVAGIGGVGPCHGVELAGSSLIVDAKGSVVADGGTAEGWLVAEVDPDETRAWREEFPLRRPTRS